MAIYTGSGDGGFTGLPGPAGKTRKDDARLAALGTIDELNAAIGLCAVEARRAGHGSIRETLCGIQQELLRLGAVLAAVGAGAQASIQLGPTAVERMEKEIDRISAELPELRHFIVPGGSELAGRLHAARTVARRAERAAIAALNPAPPESVRPGRPAGDNRLRQHAPQALLILKYLNRLSDLLFALARLANRDAGETDVIWQA